MNGIEQLIELLHRPQFRKNVINFTVIAVIIYIVYKRNRGMFLYEFLEFF